MPAVKFLAMPFGDLRRKLDQSLVYDWAMRCPAVLFSSFILYRDVLSFCQKVVHNPALFEHFNGAVVIAMLAQISQWMFVFLLSILPLFRLRPIAKSDEILPRVVPLIVTCVPPMFMLLERAPPDIAFNVPAVVIILLANVMAVATVSFLGRSLSLMPEARRLVRIGPYNRPPPVVFVRDAGPWWHRLTISLAGGGRAAAVGDRAASGAGPMGRRRARARIPGLRRLPLADVVSDTA